MSDWLAVPRYSPRPLWVITLECGHGGTIEDLTHLTGDYSMPRPEQVYICWRCQLPARATSLWGYRP